VILVWSSFVKGDADGMATGADLFGRPPSEGAFCSGPRWAGLRDSRTVRGQRFLHLQSAGPRRLRGLTTALPKCGRPGRKLDHHLDALVAHVAAHPDATLAELVEWSNAQRGVKVCIATMWATLEALGMTLKKRPAMPPSKNAKMLRRRGRLGARAKPTSASIGLSLSMRPGRQPT
jgi:hypothetical protein